MTAEELQQEHVTKLAEAMWQLLDDMGQGQSVCLQAKAMARVAYEPFRQPDDPLYMSMADAEYVLKMANADHG